MLTWTAVSWRMASSAQRAVLSTWNVPGAIAIHTCARDAWLGEASMPALPGERLHGRDAVVRFLGVACGLDSAVQGEADIGRQVRAALARSDVPIAAVLDHVLARLLRKGRQAGWLRDGEGVATLAARAVGAGDVAIVGAGALGSRVAHLLPHAARYNRSERDGALPLEAMAPAATWIVTTAAPAAWFRPPGDFVRILDLGHPAQALDEPRRVSLDVLLDGADARLSPAQVRAAEAAVEAAADEVIGRLLRRAA